MSVGGLASGLDTNSIIAQLTALEQAKVTREVQKKESAQSTLDKFKELETRLGNLQAKAKTLELPKDFNMFKASSNYEEYATVSGGEGATAGQYELVVHQLATTQKVASESFKAINESMEECIGMASGSKATITLSTSAAVQKADPKKTGVDVVINASDTLKDIVNKINAAEGAGVKASLMTMANGDNRIVLTAVDTGTHGFHIADSLAAGSSFELLKELGILSSGDGNEATSGNALLTKDGAATNETTFEELNTKLLTKIENGDKIGVYVDGNWISTTINIGDSIEAVLSNLNGDLGAKNLQAELNDSGEIVLKSTDGFTGIDLSKVKIVIGKDDLDEEKNIKRDLGKITAKNSFANVINDAQNAFYTIDGMAIGSQSNSDDKTINGTTFTLKKVSVGIGKLDEPIKLSLTPDMSSLADKIGAFVEEFNALLKFIDENAKATIKEDTDKATGKKTSTRVVGAFTGDSGISSLRDNLRQMFSGTINEIAGIRDNGYSTDYSSASRLGMITNKEGYFDIDKEKLTKALNADFEGVRRLFTSGGFSDTNGFGVGRFGKDAEVGIYEYDGVNWFLNGSKDPVQGSWTGNNIFTTKNGLNIELPDGASAGAKVTFVRGIAGQLSNFVEKAKSGYYSETMEKFVDGYFKQSKDTYQKRIDEIQKRVDQLQLRVDNYNTRLVKQFSSLERSMSNLQAQSANMMSALSGISYKR
jgi:flagellar hook-associated protein 2